MSEIEDKLRAMHEDDRRFCFELQKEAGASLTKWWVESIEKNGVGGLATQETLAAFRKFVRAGGDYEHMKEIYLSKLGPTVEYLRELEIDVDAVLRQMHKSLVRLVVD